MQNIYEANEQAIMDAAPYTVTFDNDGICEWLHQTAREHGEVLMTAEQVAAAVAELNELLAEDERMKQELAEQEEA